MLENFLSEEKHCDQVTHLKKMGLMKLRLKVLNLLTQP